MGTGGEAAAWAARALAGAAGAGALVRAAGALVGAAGALGAGAAGALMAGAAGARAAGALALKAPRRAGGPVGRFGGRGGGQNSLPGRAGVPSHWRGGV